MSRGERPVTSRPFKMGGRFSSNWTSTTAPMTATILPFEKPLATFVTLNGKKSMNIKFTCALLRETPKKKKKNARSCQPGLEPVPEQQLRSGHPSCRLLWSCYVLKCSNIIFRNFFTKRKEKIRAMHLKNVQKVHKKKHKYGKK